MELLDRVQLSYDISDQDIADITDGVCSKNNFNKFVVGLEDKGNSESN